MATTGRLDLHGVYAAADQSGQLVSYRRRKWGRRGEFISWLEQEALWAMDESQALTLYRCSGGREPREFIGNGIEELRDTFDFLLYDTIKLEGRFDECAAPDGAYKLRGVGKEFVSYLLCLRDPSLFGVWNANAERLLRRAGLYPESMQRGPVGIRYLEFLEASVRLRYHLGFGDFTLLDELGYLLARSKREN